jgi:hypothetical protein
METPSDAVEEQEPDYDPPRVTIHGTVAEITAAHQAGPHMDHHFPSMGQPGGPPFS